jgi:hypothetical protein
VAVFLSTLTCGVAEDHKGEKNDEKPKRKYSIGKTTTYVDGPLDKDGHINYPAALNARMGKGVTPANNANVLIWNAVGPRPQGDRRMPAEFFKLLGITEPPEKGDYLIDFARYRKEHLKVTKRDTGDDTFGPLIRAPWAAKDHPECAAWLKASEKPLAIFVEASKRTEYFSPLVPPRTDLASSSLMGARLPAVQSCRVAGHALAARAMLRAGQRRHEEAWQDLLACHRLGRLIARGGTLIEFLVGVALDGIATQAELGFLESAGLDPRRIQSCLRDLRKLPPFPDVADKIMMGERYMFLEHLTLLDRHGMKYLAAASGAPAQEPNPLTEHLLDNVDWNPAMKIANGWYDRLVAALRLKDLASREQTLHDITADLKALKKKLVEGGGMAKLYGGAKEAKGKVMGDLLVTMLLPAAGKVQTAADRAAQHYANLSLAFALAWYKADKGSYPQKLAELAPKYVNAIPLDIFSGKPLIYRPSVNGYLLYSVGVNGTDDEGRGPEDKPKGDDLAVRMPRAGK